MDSFLQRTKIYQQGNELFFASQNGIYLSPTLPLHSPFITIPHIKNAIQKHLQNICMDYSIIREDLIEERENNDDDEQSFYLEDDTADSNFIYILNTVLSGTARLNVLLPTATILAFTIFAPILTNDGKCDTVERWLMSGFLAVSAISCAFFSFTDSFRSASGRLHYGVATFHGIWTFNGGRTKPCVAADYRLRWADLFHASLSLIAFFTFAASHNDVLSCYHFVLPRKITNTVPLVVGFVVSLLFVIFPSRRRGIGYPFLLQSDIYYRY